jgi:integrase
LKIVAKVLLLVSLIVLPLLLITGCSCWPRVEGSGELETREIDCSTFVVIEISDAFEADIIEAESFSVRVTADDNLFPYLEVKQDGYTLNIGLKPSHNYCNTTRKVRIEMPIMALYRLKNLKLPKAPAKIMEPLKPQEIRLILNNINKDSATGIRNHAILETMLDTGLRASGIADISISGLNLKDGYIKVMGKGSKERIVPIGKHVQMTLFSYIDKTRPVPIKPSCNKLFLSRSGKPITPNTIKLMFSRLAKKSKVNRLHAHLCRHTFSINYLLNGGDIFSLKEILGHTTLDMVNHYLHFTSAQIVMQHHKYSPMDKLLMKPDSGTHAGDLVLAP